MAREIQIIRYIHSEKSRRELLLQVRAERTKLLSEGTFKGNFNTSKSNMDEKRTLYSQVRY